MKTVLILIIIACFFGLFCTPIYSQSFQEKLDEAEALMDSDPLKSETLLKEVLSVDSVDVPLLIRAKTLQFLGLGLMYNNQFNEAGAYFKRSENLYALIDINNETKNQLASLTMDIGRSYTWQGLYDLALENFLSARVLYEETNNLQGLASTLNAIAIIYGQFNEDFESALVIFKEALAINEDLKDTLSMAKVMQNIGQIYELTQQLDSALLYLKISNGLSEKFGDYRSLAVGNNIIGSVFYALEELDSSEYYYLEAIQLDIQNQDSVGLVFDYYMLSSTLIKKKDFTNAKRYAMLAYENTGDIGIKFETAKNMSLIYEAQGNTKKALTYYKEFKALEDSVRSQNQREVISELQTQYETEKKEAEITRLSLENDLKDSRILAGGISGGLVIILLIVFFSLRSKKLKAEKEAQELQIEAMKKRFMELHSSPAELAVDLDIEELNGKLHTPLTEREFDSLKLSIEGKTNAEIAGILFISVSTVKFHLRNTYSKMGVGNRKEAFQYMLKTS